LERLGERLGESLGESLGENLGERWDAKGKHHKPPYNFPIPFDIGHLPTYN
jgi:hypothetical protein